MPLCGLHREPSDAAGRANHEYISDVLLPGHGEALLHELSTVARRSAPYTHPHHLRTGNVKMLLG